MRATYDFETGQLTLSFRTPEAARDFLAGVRAEGGLQVELERRLSQYDVATVSVELGQRRAAALECYAARIEERSAGAFVTAFVVREWTGGDDEEILAGLAEPSPPDQPADLEEPPAVGEVRGVAAVHRVRKMNMGQKAIHAQRADRSERQVLLRDNAPQVLQGLLVNPRIEAKEVLRIAKSTYATGAILQRIAGDSRWGKNREILAAVVRNPKSPTLTVTRLVDKLRTSDLRQMAKMSSGLKEVVRKAALREYMKRSGQ